MIMELRSLLSWAMLDTSGHGSGNSTPKRPNPVVIITPPPHKLKDLPKPVDASAQVNAPDDVEMAEASLGEVPTTISPIAVTPRSRSITPPADVGQLLEKANKALEELLATKSSIDAHRWKAVWELGMELHRSLLKKLEPSAPVLSGKPKPPALQPSGKLRPEGPPRLSHSTANMPRP